MRLIALTGYGHASSRRQVTSAGFSEHFVKPISFEALVASIERSETGGTRTSRSSASSGRRGGRRAIGGG
jgi:hypothetical protein